MTGNGDAARSAVDPADLEDQWDEGCSGGEDDVGKAKEEEECDLEVVVTVVVSPPAASENKACLLRSDTYHEQCRVCQEEKEEVLIDLGCHCKGGLSKAHKSCIDAWFHPRGSNKCEICQEAAANILPPDSNPTAYFWVWRMDSSLQGPNDEEPRRWACFSPLWMAFSIIIGGLLLDALISITLGVSALPVNIIIGVIVVLGLGTAVRLALEFCREWSSRRVDMNMNLGYPAGM